MQRARLKSASAFIVGAILVSLSFGVSAHDDGRYHDRNHNDGYTGASQQWHEGELSDDARRDLRRFDQQKHRDYRRLGQRHFDSHREKERAYRELRREHRDRLQDILGDS